MKFSVLNPSIDFRDGDNYYEYKKDLFKNNNQEFELN